MFWFCVLLFLAAIFQYFVACSLSLALRDLTTKLNTVETLLINKTAADVVLVRTNEQYKSDLNETIRILMKRTNITN